MAPAPGTDLGTESDNELINFNNYGGSRIGIRKGELPVLNQFSVIVLWQVFVPMRQLSKRWNECCAASDFGACSLPFLSFYEFARREKELSAFFSY